MPAKIIPVVLAKHYTQATCYLLDQLAGGQFSPVAAIWGQPVEPGQYGRFAIKPRHFTGNWIQIMDRLIKGLAREQVEADYVWMLSDDVHVSPDLLPALEAALSTEEAERWAMCSPVWNSSYEWCKPQASNERVREVVAIEPTAPVLSIKAWHAIGGYDPRFVRGWGVAEDYAIRARRLRYQCVVLPELMFNHDGQRTVRGEPGGYGAYRKQAKLESEQGLTEKYGPDWHVELFREFGHQITPAWRRARRWPIDNIPCTP